MGYLTDEEISALQLTTLDRSTPFVITNVSYTQLSVARHFGGCKFKGKDYTYTPATDELIRNDVLRWLVKYRKKPKDEKKEAHQGLFD